MSGRGEWQKRRTAFLGTLTRRTFYTHTPTPQQSPRRGCWQVIIVGGWERGGAWTGNLCGLLDKEPSFRALFVFLAVEHAERQPDRLPPQSDSFLPPGFTLRLQGDDMRCHLAVFLLACFALFHLGSALRCYKCNDYTGQCENVQECTDQDACISLSERGGKTIRQCIRYTDCDNSRLASMYPNIASFTYRCCSSSLCNSADSISAATLFLALAGSLLSMWWSWP